jgi:O-acetyl-ADP-ribose deacetylase
LNILLVRTDVASLKVDAIVAPTDPQTHETSGRAVVVTGGNLLARFVIHVHVPNAADPNAAELLHASTIKALERAEDLAIASVGLPAIGTGVYGFSVEDCARIMLGAAVQHRTRARSLQRAVFCLFGHEEYNVFERVMGELKR